MTDGEIVNYFTYRQKAPIYESHPGLSQRHKGLEFIEETFALQYLEEKGGIFLSINLSNVSVRRERFLWSFYGVTTLCDYSDKIWTQHFFPHIQG